MPKNQFLLQSNRFSVQSVRFGGRTGSIETSRTEYKRITSYFVIISISDYDTGTAVLSSSQHRWVFRLADELQIPLFRFTDSVRPALPQEYIDIIQTNEGSQLVIQALSNYSDF